MSTPQQLAGPGRRPGELQEGRWAPILAELPAAKLRHVRAALGAPGGPDQATAQRIIVEGESDETLARWWAMLTGKEIEGWLARRRFLLPTRRRASS